MNNNKNHLQITNTKFYYQTMLQSKRIIISVFIKISLQKLRFKKLLEKNTQFFQHGGNEGFIPFNFFHKRVLR